MTRQAWRPIGFLLLMLGFGLRLDTGWQALAWVVLVGGAGCTVAGLRSTSDLPAFVPRRSRR